MSNPTITDYLKYANLQMAAEAFLFDEATQKVKTDINGALIAGNGHASRFTATQATDFVTHWKVVDQRANTSTGFSGTLFQCIADDPTTGAHKGEYVLSMRRSNRGQTVIPPFFSETKRRKSSAIASRAAKGGAGTALGRDSSAGVLSGGRVNIAPHAAFPSYSRPALA